MLPSIRKFGAYVDPNHKIIRELTKMVRKDEVSAIADLIRYGKLQGYFVDPKNVYSNLTYKTQCELCGIPVDGRDASNSSDLLTLLGVELIVRKTINHGLRNDKNYPTIYNNILRNVKYYLSERLEFVHDKKTYTISVNVEEKTNNVIIKWDGFKVKIPKE